MQVRLGENILVTVDNISRGISLDNREIRLFSNAADSRAIMTIAGDDGSRPELAWLPNFDGLWHAAIQNVSGSWSTDVSQSAWTAWQDSPLTELLPNADLAEQLPFRLVELRFKDGFLPPADWAFSAWFNYNSQQLRLINFWSFSNAPVSFQPTIVVDGQGWSNTVQFWLLDLSRLNLLSSNFNGLWPLLFGVSRTAFEASLLSPLLLSFAPVPASALRTAAIDGLQWQQLSTAIGVTTSINLNLANSLQLELAWSGSKITARPVSQTGAIANFIAAELGGISNILVYYDMQIQWFDNSSESLGVTTTTLLTENLNSIDWRPIPPANASVGQVRGNLRIVRLGRELSAATNLTIDEAQTSLLQLTPILLIVNQPQPQSPSQTIQQATIQFDGNLAVQGPTRWAIPMSIEVLNGTSLNQVPPVYVISPVQTNVAIRPNGVAADLLQTLRLRAEGETYSPLQITDDNFVVFAINQDWTQFRLLDSADNTIAMFIRDGQAAGQPPISTAPIARSSPISTAPSSPSVQTSTSQTASSDLG